MLAYVAYVSITGLALIIVYTICRLVDHFLQKKETGLTMENVGTLIGYGTEQFGMMSYDLIKKINAETFKMLNTDFGEKKEDEEP